jgi:TRAP-type C4-dicarboxylate transport system permease small subunit
MSQRLRNAWAVLEAPEDALGVLLLAVVFAVMLAAVLFRYLLNDSLIWAEEVARYAFVGLVYAGIATGFRRRSHVRIDLIDVIAPRLVPWLAAVVWVASVAFLSFLLMQAVGITGVLRSSRSAALQMPMAWLYWMLATGILLGIVRLLWIGWRAARGGPGP